MTLALPVTQCLLSGTKTRNVSPHGKYLKKTRYIVLEVDTTYVRLGITAAIVVVLILVGIALFVGYKGKGLIFNKQEVRLNKELLMYLLPKLVSKEKGRKVLLTCESGNKTFTVFMCCLILYFL